MADRIVAILEGIRDNRIDLEDVDFPNEQTRKIMSDLDKKVEAISYALSGISSEIQNAASSVDEICHISEELDQIFVDISVNNKLRKYMK